MDGGASSEVPRWTGEYVIESACRVPRDNGQKKMVKLKQSDRHEAAILVLLIYPISILFLFQAEGSF
jgi:hypothetical protein